MAHTMIVHSNGYSGNERSAEHLDACIKRNLSTSDMCEVRINLHVTFTPDHPAIKAFGKAHNVLCAAIDLEKHIREDHADGSPCPVSSVAQGKDWGEIEAECRRLGIKCTRGE